MTSPKVPASTVERLMLGLVVVILVLMPFHAFLTVWLASIFGHYTLLRLWKEILLLVLFAGSIYLLFTYPKLRWKLISYKLSWLIAGFALLQIICGVVALLMHHVTAKAFMYALIVDLRPLLFFLVIWLLSLHTPDLNKWWQRAVFWPLAVVVVFGLLQYFVLPYDFLKHFGYSASTIYPYSTINHNVHHLRIMSTLRGANPLGAYLVVSLSLLGAVWVKRRSWPYGVLWLGGLLAVILSFSRSAWIGLAVALGIVGWYSVHTKRARLISVSVAAVVVLAAGAVLFISRHSMIVQDSLLHTDTKSTSQISSNQGHASALESGVSDLLHEPFGRGPGTAGPASAYNDHPARIAENYFIQIGQETGWLGLLAFLAINAVLARGLWRRREHSLALGLFGALVGVSIVNLLSHAWADDTLVYLWWGLAGLSIALDMRITDDEVPAKN